jgi:superfamily II DNA or RNA helicase
MRAQHCHSDTLEDCVYLPFPMPSQLSNARSIIAKGIFDGLQNFAQLEERISALAAENTKILGDAFEMFVEGFLATQEKFLVEENWVVGNIPLAIREQLNLPDHGSLGIDGIFKTRTGSLVPYQVKFRSNRVSLSYNEVAAFLGVTERATDRVIFTNSDVIAVAAKNRDAMRTVRGIDFDELMPEDFEAIAGWLTEKPITTPKLKPRDYQLDGLEQISATLSEHDRATAVMACGTGKTLLALWAAERLEPQTVLVMLPSLTLVQQTLDEWSRHNSWGQRFSYICVCSDRTVAGTDAIQLDNMDVEFPVSTDPAQVRTFLEGSGGAVGQVRVVFSTYQSSKIVSEGAKGLPAFDLGIFDEAHKTTGPKGGLFAHALSDDNIQIAKRLFLTATPRHFDIRHKDREGDFEVTSMDDDAVYGPRAYTLTFGEAAERGIICDYKVVISVVSGDEIDQFSLKHGITLIEGDEVGAKWVANQLSIERAIERTSAKRAITFHSRVSMAKEFASDTTRGVQQFLDGFSLFHVNGEQKSSERKQLIKAFRDAPKAIITNARCLTEGIDIPAVDMVAFIDPRRSKVDIAQAAGRAMRKPYGSDKAAGYVVIPLFLELQAEESFDAAVERSDFSDVAAVLNAMREQDDDLVDIIKALKVAKGRGEAFDPKALKDKVEVLGPAVEFDALSASIFAEIVDAIGVSWDEWFGRLQAYKHEHGNCLVPHGFTTADGYRLGFWVNTQRTKKGAMPAERRQRLESIGFVWDPYSEAWEAGFAALQAYKHEHGNCLAPQGFTTADGYGLGTWVATQRGNKGAMPAERRQRLESIGFVWDQVMAAWEAGFAALQAYKHEHGDCLVSLGFKTADGFKLGAWVRGRRTNKGAMPAERRQRLEDIGFVWDPYTEAWEAGFAALQAYKHEHGDCLVPQGFTTADGYGLGTWVGGQRTNKGAMPAERRQRLEDIGFVWDPYTEAWEAGFAALQAYKHEHGDCLVPLGFKTADGFKLGTWVGSQRGKKGAMPAERRQRLEDIGIVWKVH